MTTITPTACPPWCADKPGQDYDSVTTDGAERPSRTHSLELGTVIAEHDHGGRVAHPDVFVCLTADETLGLDRIEVTPPMIAVTAVDYPHLTADETRLVAAAMLEGAARLDGMTGRA